MMKKVVTMTKTPSSWNDLPDEERQTALKDGFYFETLKATFPQADFSERDRLLEKYAIKSRCGFCEAVIAANYLTGVPEVCPQCKRKSLAASSAPGAVADWMLKHYSFATTEDKDQNLFIYDNSTGTWSDEKADATLKRECAVIYGDNFTTQRLNNVRLSLQAKTFVARNRFSSAIKQQDGKILINLKNGVLDLLSDELMPLDSKYYFLGQLNVSFDRNAPVPEKFLSFLLQITLPNEENFINLLEGFAYPLIPGYPIQRSFALIGAGSNGKSTYLKALELFYGEKYIAHLTMQQLSSAIEGQPFSLAQLIGKLANVADDLPAKAIKDVGYFKQLTGGSSVEAERKFGNRMSFVNEAKFYFAANTMPAVSEDTVAFFRRFLFIEFSNVIKSPKDQKEVLTYMMSEAERSGLFNLLLVYVVPRLLKQNDFTFAKSTEEVAEQYQRHSNTSKLFFDRMLEYDPEGLIKKEDLFSAYQKFCGEEGLLEVSSKAFWMTFRELFSQAIEQQYQEDGVHKRSIRGIRFKPQVTENVVPKQSKVSLETYFEDNHDNQDNQDIPLFIKSIEVYKKIKDIKGKVGFSGNAGSLPEATASSSNTILENHTSTAQSGLNTTFQPSNEASPQGDGAAAGQPNNANPGQGPSPGPDAPKPAPPKELDLGGASTVICPVCGSNTSRLWDFAGSWMCTDCLNTKQHKNDNAFGEF